MIQVVCVQTYCGKAVRYLSGCSPKDIQLKVGKTYWVENVSDMSYMLDGHWIGKFHFITLEEHRQIQLDKILI